MFEQVVTSKLKLKVTELIFPEISLGVQPVLGTLKVCEVTRDDLQRRFLAQHIVAMLEECSNYSKKCRNNVATLCYAKIVVANRLV